MNSFEEYLKRVSQSTGKGYLYIPGTKPPDILLDFPELLEEADRRSKEIKARRAESKATIERSFTDRGSTPWPKQPGIETDITGIYKEVKVSVSNQSVIPEFE